MDVMVVDFLLMLAIGGLAGLVVALHLRLRQFMKEANKVPALADDLTQAISASRVAIQNLQKAARSDGAKLEELLTRAESNRQDLTFILDRTEKALARFDAQPVAPVERGPHASEQQSAFKEDGQSSFSPYSQGLQSSSSFPHQQEGQQERAYFNGPHAQNMQGHTGVQAGQTSQEYGHQASPQAVPHLQAFSTPQAAPFPALNRYRQGEEAYKPASLHGGASAYSGAEAFNLAPEPETREQELQRALERL